MSTDVWRCDCGYVNLGGSECTLCGRPQGGHTASPPPAPDRVAAPGPAPVRVPRARPGRDDGPDLLALPGAHKRRAVPPAAVLLVLVALLLVVAVVTVLVRL
jgi:hypothetical protein